MWDFIFSLIYRQSCSESGGHGRDDGMSVPFNGPLRFWSMGMLWLLQEFFRAHLRSRSPTSMHSSGWQYSAELACCCRCPS